MGARERRRGPAGRRPGAGRGDRREHRGPRGRRRGDRAHRDRRGRDRQLVGHAPGLGRGAAPPDRPLDRPSGRRGTSSSRPCGRRRAPRRRSGPRRRCSTASRTSIEAPASSCSADGSVLTNLTMSGAAPDRRRGRSRRRPRGPALPAAEGGRGVTTWIVLRAAGIGAYLMLFFSVAWGLASTTSVFGKRISKASMTTVHQFTATCGLFLLAGPPRGAARRHVHAVLDRRRHHPHVDDVPPRRRDVRHRGDVPDRVRDRHLLAAQADRHEVVAPDAPAGRADVRPVDGARRVRRNRHGPAGDVVDLPRHRPGRTVPARGPWTHLRVPARAGRAPGSPRQGPRRRAGDGVGRGGPHAGPLEEPRPGELPAPPPADHAQRQPLEPEPAVA